MYQNDKIMTGKNLLLKEIPSRLIVNLAWNLGIKDL
jgi:hypothetical protein